MDPTHDRAELSAPLNADERRHIARCTPCREYHATAERDPELARAGRELLRRHVAADRDAVRFLSALLARIAGLPSPVVRRGSNPSRVTLSTAGPSGRADE